MIRHLLLDADGVLQRVDPGWLEAVRPLVGDRGRELLETFWAAEQPALSGRADVVELLADSLRRLGIDAPADEVYPRIWLRIEVLAHTRALVRRARDAGLGVHLGTNQTRHRALHMRRVLGYDELFDVSAYSCDLGVAKPDVGFYAGACALIGAPRDEVLFVDDHERNVVGARAAGLAAEHWHHTQGLPVLVSHLAAHGVTLGP